VPGAVDQSGIRIWISIDSGGLLVAFDQLLAKYFLVRGFRV
jgi:hypothetical protein